MKLYGFDLKILGALQTGERMASARLAHQVGRYCIYVVTKPIECSRDRYFPDPIH